VQQFTRRARVTIKPPIAGDAADQIARAGRQAMNARVGADGTASDMMANPGRTGRWRTKEQSDSVSTSQSGGVRRWSGEGHEAGHEHEAEEDQLTAMPVREAPDDWPGKTVSTPPTK